MLYELPSYVNRAIWLPLVGVFIVICVFSFFYIRRFRKKYEQDRISFLVSVIALVLVFVLTSLAPVDTFIASEMKYHNGTFKEWASNLTYREILEENVLIGYIVLYSLICFTVFCVLPFTYFLYDNRDDENENGGSNVCSALISTLVVLIVPALIVVLSFLPDIGKDNNTNSTIIVRVQSNGTKIISNLICVLGGIGMINLIIYTGFGLSTWPIALIRGKKDLRKEYDEISRRQTNTTAAINSLRSKRSYLGRLNEEDDRLLNQLETREREDQLRETITLNQLSSWGYKFKYITRPIEITIGFLFLIISTTIIVSLVINNIDCLIHSSAKESYLIKERTIFNPIDYLLTELNTIYPLDYIIYLAIAWYLIFCTLSGLQNLGIGLFFFKLGKFRSGQTTPQGLILASSVLMMSMMAINLIMFSIAPIYSSYGNQIFKSNGTDTQCDLTSKSEDCTMTRSTYIIVTYFYHISYVGMGFFYSTWFVALFFVLALIYSMCRKQQADNEYDREDFEEESQAMSGSFRYRNLSRPF